MACGLQFGPDEEIAALQNSLSTSVKTAEEGQAAQAAKTAEVGLLAWTTTGLFVRGCSDSREEITALRNALTASEKKAEEGQAAQAAKTTEECVGSFLAQLLLLLYFLCAQGDHDIAEFLQFFGEEDGGKPGSAGHQNDRGGGAGKFRRQVMS